MERSTPSKVLVLTKAGVFTLWKFVELVVGREKGAAGSVGIDR
jgi:hypothetical protein